METPAYYYASGKALIIHFRSIPCALKIETFSRLSFFEEEKICGILQL